MMNYTGNNHCQSSRLNSINSAQVPKITFNSNTPHTPYTQQAIKMAISNNSNTDKYYQKPRQYYYQSKNSYSLKTQTASKNIQINYGKLARYPSKVCNSETRPKTKATPIMSGSFIAQLEESKLSKNKFQALSPSHAKQYVPQHQLHPQNIVGTADYSSFSAYKTSNMGLNQKNSCAEHYSQDATGQSHSQRVRYDWLQKKQLPTYRQLQAQNGKLKQLIKTEYEPIKQCYQRLVKQQQDRDYLVAQLEWKIKQLARQTKCKNKN